MRINVIIIGTDISNSFEAGSLRVRNLFDTILDNPKYSVINIIEEVHLTSENDNLQYVKISGWFRLFSIVSLFLRLKKESSNTILYNYNSISFLFGDYIFIAKILRIPIVFDVVENIHVNVEYTRLLSLIKIHLNRFSEKVIYWYASGCITISNNLFKMFIEFSKYRCPIVHLPISVLMREWEYTFSKDNSELIIFYGGSFGPKDGLEYLIKAFDRVAYEFPSCVLHLSGKGATRHMIKIKDFLKNITNKDRIKMLGSLERCEYVKNVVSADVVCVTRTNSKFANYGFPFKLGEYLAAGKAIIVSDISDVSTYLENEIDAFIIEPESVDAIEFALRKLLKNEKLRLELGKNAKIKALKYFDSKKVGLNFELFLNKILH